ncbi:hypothetical protein ACQKJZ_08565 [Sphingomonas sp. NPDC019816]|uniref:hypothetical protein n=1 Tax=Sphingomonas sp. NPDC019816 TaxID=3390679 RepID=UPI003D01FA7B
MRGMTATLDTPAIEPVEPPVVVVNDVTPVAAPAVAQPVERPRRKLSLHYGARPGERP